MIARAFDLSGVVSASNPTVYSLETWKVLLTCLNLLPAEIRFRAIQWLPSLLQKLIAESQVADSVELVKPLRDPIEHSRNRDVK